MMTRRDCLKTFGTGFGMTAFAGLFGSSMPAVGAMDTNPLAPKAPHFPAKAKHVIFLFLNGGPSQVDTFDPKPMLDKYNGKPMPRGNLKTERKTGNLMQVAVSVQAIRSERDRGQRDLPETGRAHRRCLRDPLDVHGPPQSRAFAVHDECGR